MCIVYELIMTRAVELSLNVSPVHRWARVTIMQCCLMFTVVLVIILSMCFIIPVFYSVVSQRV